MPEREWVLLNPGPANTSPAVRRALLTPDLCHREPEFFEVMRNCRERLVRVVGCAADFAAVVLTGSGTAAVEATVCSAVPRGRALLVVKNGVWKGQPPRSVYLDLYGHYASQEADRTPFTPAVQVLHATRDMEAVVLAFGAALADLGVAR